MSHTLTHPNVTRILSPFIFGCSIAKVLMSGLNLAIQHYKEPNGWRNFGTWKNVAWQAKEWSTSSKEFATWRQTHKHVEHGPSPVRGFLVYVPCERDEHSSARFHPKSGGPTWQVFTQLERLADVCHQRFTLRLPKNYHLPKGADFIMATRALADSTGDERRMDLRQERKFLAQIEFKPSQSDWNHSDPHVNLFCWSLIAASCFPMSCLNRRTWPYTSDKKGRLLVFGQHEDHSVFRPRVEMARTLRWMNEKQYGKWTIALYNISWTRWAMYNFKGVQKKSPSSINFTMWMMT